MSPNVLSIMSAKMYNEYHVSCQLKFKMSTGVLIIIDDECQRKDTFSDTHFKRILAPLISNHSPKA